MPWIITPYFDHAGLGVTIKPGDDFRVESVVVLLGAVEFGAIAVERVRHA